MLLWYRALHHDQARVVGGAIGLGNVTEVNYIERDLMSKTRLPRVLAGGREQPISEPEWGTLARRATFARVTSDRNLFL